MLGDGKLGLLIAQVLAALGARVHLSGRHKEKMKLVESALITTEVRGKKGLDPTARDRIGEVVQGSQTSGASGGSVRRQRYLSNPAGPKEELNISSW
jgi:hypothetical protein